MSDNEPGFIDAMGSVHQPAQADCRIACLVPSITELLFDLDLGERVVARTGFCIHPSGLVEQIPKVGGTKQTNFKKLRALHPTHVILNREENTRECALTLSEFVPNLIVTYPRKFLDNLELYSLLGGVFNRQEKAAQIAKNLTDSLSLLPDSVSALRVMYFIWRDPWMIISPSTYIADTLSLIGLHPIAVPSSHDYPSIDLESVDWQVVDAIFLSSEPYKFVENDVGQLSDAVFELSGKRVPVVLVDGELLSWYGSRALKTPEYLMRLRQQVESEIAGARNAR